MSTERDAVLRERRANIEGWFDKHVATFSEGEVGGVRVERLVWKRPDSSIYRVDYACIGGTVLCVSGDLGEAVYNTGAKSLEWWKRCDVSYFASKCYASESGRGFKEWDDDIARARFDEEIHRMREEDGAVLDEDAIADGRETIASGRGEWDAWMREHAHELFGDDWWDFVPNFGVIVAMRCEAHLIGLKMAFQSLSTSTELVTADADSR